MLATMEQIEIINFAEQLANMIIQSETAEQYRRCYHKLYTDEQTKRKIQAFVQLKERYEEVQRFGKYHPDYKEVTRKIREVKREMDLDENVANFKRAENDMQQLLDEISRLIGHAVSPQIKVPTGNPFFDSLSSCGGGCGSGGACGCSS
ncbi:MAG: YlbF family regulator [Bacillus sp. (in: Bacteria)]|nr:YlbF family regulator [Bacillus sp. (in: firmicutes)]